MGADITESGPATVGGEPVADLRVRGAALKGLEIPPEWVPLAIDEFPVLFVAAACAEGVTVVRGAEELRVKESDRIAVMAEGLAAIGMRVRAHAGRDAHRRPGRAGDARSPAGPSLRMVTIASPWPLRSRRCARVAPSPSSIPRTSTRRFPGSPTAAGSVGLRVGTGASS